MENRIYSLAQIRALANLSARDAADLLKIHYNTYLRLEKNPGNLTMDQALILAEAAGIGIEQIKI